MNYIFEWDPGKASSNLQKHGVNFGRGAQIFLDPLMVSIYDEEHSENQERWITIGVDQNDIVLVVVHTFETIDDESTTIRIISARKATRREAQVYRGR